MLKAEQIPDAVVAAYEDGRWNLDLSVAESLAHALNAWPGVGPIRTDQPIGEWCDKLPAIILPLPQPKENGG